MKVKLLVPRTGADGASNIGDIIDVDDAEAKRMMEANPPQCEPVRTAKKIPERTKK